MAGAGGGEKREAVPLLPWGLPQRAVAKSRSLPLTSHRRTNLQLDPTEASLRC